MSEAAPLFAGVKGYLDGLSLDKIYSFVIWLRKKVEEVHPEWIYHLNSVGDLSESEMDELAEFIQKERDHFQGGASCPQ